MYRLPIFLPTYLPRSFNPSSPMAIPSPFSLSFSTRKYCAKVVLSIATPKVRNRTLQILAKYSTAVGIDLTFMNN